jgi:hypothetical protein
VLHNFNRLFQKNKFMKRVLRLFSVLGVALLTYTGANAQLPAGSIAPNFTKTDINGVEHTLYDLLDEGYSVVLDFSATWCGPCWSYHTAGTLHDLYADYGPDGADKCIVWSIEADDDTTLEDLNGTGSNTQGDWVTGVDYPIFDDCYDIFLDYACTYYPTIYTVCPNRLITETGQASLSAHKSFIDDSACQPASLNNDPGLINYLGDLATCDEIDAVVRLMNMGTGDLMMADITVNGCANCPITENWTGNLATYAFEDVTISGVQITANTTLEIAITSSDDNTANNDVSAAVVMADDATTEIHVDFMTDCWPDEFSYELIDGNGTVQASGNGYTDALTEHNMVHWVPTGCYTFVYTDGYGDGLNGASWNSCGVDGWLEVKTYDAGSVFSEVYNYDGSYWIEEDFAAANVNTVVNVVEANIQESLNIYPNPTSDVANVNFTVAGASEVSLDVMNLLGERVITLDMGTVMTGQHITQLDFNGLEAGLYLVNMTVNGNVTTMKVTLTK